MVHAPSSREEIAESVESRLRGRIAKLTNFVESSFNKVFLETFSDVMYTYEVRLLASQLSGWVEYAGGPITQDDLDQLGLRGFNDVELLNEYMEDSQLDNLGSIVGVERDLGSPATGQVRVDVFDNTTRVPDGMRVSTPPNVDGEQLVYTVDLGDEDTVSPDDQGNSDYVVVDIAAVENGDEYNVGSGRINRFRSPPPGVENVVNPQTVEGGEDAESNDQLRERIQNAVFETSGGGTTEGIRGYILGNVDGVNDVFIDEFISATPVYVDVVVDGGVESLVRDAIETSRPAGIRHNLVRPVTYHLAVEIEAQGTDIDTIAVKTEIEDYVFDLDLGEDFIRDKIVQRVLNIESDIENILAINARITEVTEQRVQFNSGDNIYDLAEAPLGKVGEERHYFDTDKSVYQFGIDPVDDTTVTLEAITNGTRSTLTQGTDYAVIDESGNGMLNAIDFSIGGTNPDDDTVFNVSYDTKTDASETFTYDTNESDYPLTYLPALAQDSTVTDADTNTYTLGTDYDIIDVDGDGEKDTLRWLSDGTSPADATDFTVDYEVNVGSIYRVTGTLNGTDGHTFVEGTDYNELDDSGDGYPDAIDWSLAGDTPDDGTDFVIESTVQNDVIEDYDVTQREKVTPVVDEVEVLTYE